MNLVDVYKESRSNNSTYIVYNALKRYFDEHSISGESTFGFFKNDLDILDFIEKNTPSNSFYAQRASLTLNVSTRKTLEVLKNIDHLFVLNSESLKKIHNLNASVLPHFLYIDRELHKEEKFADFTVINISSPFMHKGTLESLNIFWKTLGSFPEAKFICVGGDKKDYESYMKKDQLYFTDKIKFYKSLSNIETQKLIRKSHVFLSATMGEGCSLGQLEALYLGTPLLITKTSYHEKDQPWLGRANLIDSIKVKTKNFVYDSIISQSPLEEVLSYEPSNIDGILKLRDIYSNYKTYLDQSNDHSAWMKINWSPEKIMDKYFWPHIR